MKQTYVYDIDDTLISSKKTFCDCCGRVKYELYAVYQDEIDILRKLKDKGHKIILWTGRNWDCYDVTVQQLREANVPYDELVMGKPQGVYVDKDALRSGKEIKDEL